MDDAVSGGGSGGGGGVEKSSQQSATDATASNNNDGVARPTHHFHDSFGDDADNGVDYGPPIELEEEKLEEQQQHDGDDGNIKNSTVHNEQISDDNNTNNNTSSSVSSLKATAESNTNSSIITLEELEETAGLHEATLESLHVKLSKLNAEITSETQVSTTLQRDIEILKRKKIVLKKQTENNVQLIKELEGSLERCLERLRRSATAMDVEGEEEDDDAMVEEVGENDEHDLPSQVDEDGHEEVLESKPTTTPQENDFEIIKLPIINHKNQDTGNIAWPTTVIDNKKDIKRIRKEVASLPFAFPIWRTSEFSACTVFTTLDSSSKQLLLDIMNTIVLEHLLWREENNVDGCGQVHQAKIWGTSLDIMIQVKWEHLLPRLKYSSLEEAPTTTTSSSESRLDPNLALCPYELGGTCADDRCPYQHLSRPLSSRQDETSSSADQDYEVIKYHSLPKPALPVCPSFECKRGADDNETDARDVDKTTADAKQSPVRQVDDEEMDSLVGPTNETGVEDNDDYVTLPIVMDVIDDHHDSATNSNKSPCELEFCEQFWWYEEHPFNASWADREKDSTGVFEKIVASFGFQKNGEFIEQIAQNSEGDNNCVKLQKRLLIDSRLIDLCRVCIHMGQASFALLVLETYHHKQGSHFYETFQHVRHEVSLSTRCSGSSQKMFDSQLSLLISSMFQRVKYESVAESSEEAPNFTDPKLLNSLRIISGKKKDAQYDELFQTLVSPLKTKRIKKQKTSSTYTYNKWEAFERSLLTVLEKHVIIPFSQITKGEEYLFFLNCIRIGKMLGRVIYKVSGNGTFSPQINALEPIWTSLKTLLQTSSTLSRSSVWFEPDLIVTVIIGPVIYACVSTTIVVTLGSKPAMHDEKKCQPKHDMRTIANMTCLDKCIVGVLKDLNKSGLKNESGEMIELLLTPLHTLSVSISMAVGMVEKAQTKLVHALGKGRRYRGIPSLYAASGALWSQLLQLRMTFPDYASPLRRTDTNSSLPNEIVASHQNVVHASFELGVILRNIVLPGDFQLSTTLLSTKGSTTKYTSMWEDIKREVCSQRCAETGQREDVTEIELVVANYMTEYSSFPYMLLLSGKTLTRLRMTNCGLKELPMSFGYCLPNLQVLNLSNNALRSLPPSVRLLEALKVLNLAHNLMEEFPDTVINCKLLEVIDLSHNKLSGYPSDLALRLPQLQSFVVDNNPV